MSWAGRTTGLQDGLLSGCVANTKSTQPVAHPFDQIGYVVYANEPEPFVMASFKSNSDSIKAMVEEDYKGLRWRTNSQNPSQLFLTLEGPEAERFKLNYDKHLENIGQKPPQR